jgi:hypothetical protein
MTHRLAAILLVLGLAPLPALAATTYRCAFDPLGGGDRIDRGFYVQDYRGYTLDTATMQFAASVPGVYTLRSTVRNGSYDGPVVATAATTVTLGNGPASTPGIFDFGSVAVAAGSTLTFTQAVTAGSGTVFYNVGNAPCSDIVETDGTDPPLSTSRRDSMGVVLTGVQANYQGLWWNSPADSEPGWGVNFAHQADTIFASWFTYDLDGSPLWMVVAAARTAPNVYSGNLYRGTGPAFSAVPFDPAKVVATPAGTASFTFADIDNATFAYTINGVAQAKNITRQAFASPIPVCAWGDEQDLAAATNYQDMWWASPPGQESGWGVNLNHQGNTVFATWFTFGLDGKPLWMVAAAQKTTGSVYEGALYTGTGPAFNATTFDPAAVKPKAVGALTVDFASGNSARFAYTVDGVAQSKQIVRQVFVLPGTVCK